MESYLLGDKKVTFDQLNSLPDNFEKYRSALKKINDKKQNEFEETLKKFLDPNNLIPISCCFCYLKIVKDPDAEIESDGYKDNEELSCYTARKLKYFQILEEAKYDEEKKEWYCNDCSGSTPIGSQTLEELNIPYSYTNLNGEIITVKYNN